MAWFRSIINWFRGLMQAGGGGSEFLCDTCAYDHPSACNRPERPNARKCPDYKRR